MKDWTGNKRSTFIQLGASNHTEKEREINDYYATDPIAIDKLLTRFTLPHNIWECACGCGHLSKRLEELGYNVYSTDIVQRGYADLCCDFLECTAKPFAERFAILTNPPYRYATEFVLKAQEILNEGDFAIFLLKTTTLEGKRRYERIYKNSPPKYIFQFTERLLCAKNGAFEEMRKGGGSAVSYAWFVWQKGYTGDTIVKWI